MRDVARTAAYRYAALRVSTRLAADQQARRAVMTGTTHLLRAVVTALLLLAVASSRAEAQPVPQEAVALFQRATEAYQAGRVDDAILLTKRALELNEKALPPGHAEIATTLNNLAFLYQLQGRLMEAEPLFKRALDMREKTLPAGHREIGLSLNNLAALYKTQGRLAEAEPLYKRALEIMEKGWPPGHPEIARSVNNLALLYQAQGRLAEAEPLLQRAVDVWERTLPAGHPDIALSVSNLADLYHAQGRLDESEALNKRALEMRQKTLPPGHPHIAQSLNNLAALYKTQGRLSEAEPLYKRALEIHEKAGPADHSNIASVLNNLAYVYQMQGRLMEAEPLFKRALEMREKALPAGHPQIGESLNNLAGLYRSQGRADDAEPLYRRALAIVEKALPVAHPYIGASLNNLGLFYEQHGRLSEAEPLLRRAVEIHEKILPSGHPDLTVSLNNLALLYQARGRLTEAEALFKRALEMQEKTLPPGHPNFIVTLNNLAALHYDKQNWEPAIGYARRASATLIERATRVPHLTHGGQTDTARSQLSDRSRGAPLEWLVLAAWQIAEQHQGQRTVLGEEALIAAQWMAQTSASAALAQMSARFAKGGGELSRLVREQQNLSGLWQQLDRQIIAARLVSSDRRDAAAEAALGQRQAKTDRELMALNGHLAKDFPDYAVLANPRPLTIKEIRAQLRPDEALVLFAFPGTEVHVWIITKTDMRWERSDLTAESLAASVAALRCGLDQAAWDGDGASRCSTLLQPTSASHANASGPLPFDLGQAHVLYQALFGQVEHLIKDKHLLIVPAGALSALPFQVLVTEKSASGIPAGATGYANAAWLAKRHAITVLPSVASLKSLRQFAKASKAPRPFIGFGNPLLVGPDGNDHRAWERQNCEGLSSPTRVVSRRIRAATPRFFRNGLADVEEVRAQYPLPETADELCVVAQSMGAGQEAVYLGAKASETTIKAVSASGMLAQARVVHFATHGLLAAETEMLAASKAEPALLWTPPTQATEEDDGLLTTSEIAQLKLDADWVVLSACNTAAGSDKPGAEALSGLARAFFYAGARALLVSHWAVNSDATVKLITKTFNEIKADSKIGRAEALRRSMLTLIAAGDGNAHPANWAPFTVVGEGR